ncbi:3-hydroxyisobutyrate dehydrogenase [Phakopsora pachyrhizi]|uniref:3-hydroxyisobutyrate dehydrogenase n=1 Tax=Phakopsora pachyrhizi TaxID=170000 RepID=A0AAV0BQT4_PHAPC|nr:3-hydroxyisobutyrate dehydrogenase [Phakopsora pachyrhizi]CAH7688719.1 3-hydroxyisobutyrate dehydrogenase [Phakopsora pachyrhizi]
MLIRNFRRVPSIGPRTNQRLEAMDQTINLNCSLMVRRISSVNHHDRDLSVGFIGLGAMGKEMASNLLTKLEPSPKSFIIYDTFQKSLTNFMDKHHSIINSKKTKIVTATSPAAVARLSSRIITMLPTSKEVEEVYLNPEIGIISGTIGLMNDKGPSSSTICIDSTTHDLNSAISVSKQLKLYDVDILDAPVSGGVVGARNGTLTFMCGGDRSIYERSLDILDSMGKRSIYCGQAGTGLAAKISNNLLLAISMIGTAEAMILGQRLGLKPDLLSDIINSSTGRCWSSEFNNPAPGSTSVTTSKPPSDRNYEPGFASRLMSKDLKLAINSAKSVSSSSDLPLLKISSEMYEKIASDLELGNKDFSVVYDWLNSKKK